MREKKQIIRYMMVVAGFIVLLSVVLPHHHHSNGLPCFSPLTEHSHHHDANDDCSSNGHSIALFSSMLSQVTDVAIDQILSPLLVLFDYINPPASTFLTQAFERSRAFYIESLHDSWIAAIGGLRAPPMS